MISSIVCCMLLASPVQNSQCIDENVNINVENLPESYLPVRERRPLTIGGELGWNSMGGLGLQMSYDLHPHFSIDGAVGLASTAVKVGARARYNVLTSNFTPFIGVGAAYGTGSSMPIEVSTNGNTVAMHIENSPFAQAVAGVSYVANGGFALQASVGYAQLLRKTSNVVIDRGTPTGAQKDALGIVYGSGPIASLMLGYAF